MLNWLNFKWCKPPTTFSPRAYRQKGPIKKIDFQNFSENPKGFFFQFLENPDQLDRLTIRREANFRPPTLSSCTQYESFHVPYKSAHTKEVLWMMTNEAEGQSTGKIVVSVIDLWGSAFFSPHRLNGFWDRRGSEWNERNIRSRYSLKP